MGQPVNRSGDFKATITEYGLREFDGNTLGVSIKCMLSHEWDRNQDEPCWVDCSRECLEAEGIVFVIKKNGTVNEFAIQSLMNHCGWDGNLVTLDNQAWQPKPCRVTVKADVYKEKTRYKIDFINSFESTPGGRGNVTKTRAAELQSKYAGALSKYGAASQPIGPAPSQDPNEIPF